MHIDYEETAEYGMSREETDRLAKELFDSALEFRRLIPARQANAVLDKSLESHQAAVRLLKEPDTKHKGLFLFGKPSRGKTYLAYALIKKLYWAKATFEVWPLPEVKLGFSHTGERVGTMLMKMRPGSDKAPVPPDHYHQGSLLLLDDLGGDPLTDWSLSTIFEIIDHWYAWNKPIIFTSNYSLKELEQRVGTPIVDRIYEMASPLEIAGQNWRRS